MIMNDAGGVPSGPIANLMAPAGAASAVAGPLKPFTLDVADGDGLNGRATANVPMSATSGPFQDGVLALSAGGTQPPASVPTRMGLPPAVQVDPSAPPGTARLAEPAPPLPGLALAVGSATQALPSQTDAALAPPVESASDLS